MPTVHEILAPLEPHWDRIVRTPLTTAEVDELGHRVGLPVPAPLREYLTEVGLFQDLTWGASDIEVYDAVEQFVSAREFLNTLLPPKHAGLFPFGGDGAGNEYCLPSGDGAGHKIQFVAHETGKVSGKKDFADWLVGVVKKVVSGIRRRPPNERKVWSVQFCLPGGSIDELLDLLGAAAAVRVIDKEWGNPQISSGKVTTVERRFEMDGEILRLSRQSYAGWDAPIHYFDMEESLSKAGGRSRIRTLDALFKARWPKYRLVNYGPLDSKALKSTATEAACDARR